MTNGEDIDLTPAPSVEGLLTPGAVAFAVELERRFRSRRSELLESRRERLAHRANGATDDFLESTAAVRDGQWQILAAPSDLAGRTVEILSPADPAVGIALAIGPRLVIADFAESQDWRDVLIGHHVVRTAAPRPANRQSAIVVRPRPWDTDETNLQVASAPVAATIFDFAMAAFHCAKSISTGDGPVFELPGTENHLEARLWNDLFCVAEDLLSMTRGSIKAIAAIEHPAARFELDEILYELREHSAGLRSTNDTIVDELAAAVCARRGAPRISSAPNAATAKVAL